MLKNNYHVAVPTAFYKNESIHIENTIKNIRRIQKQGINSVLVCGSTGEQHSLTFEEKVLLIEAIDKEFFLDLDFEIIFGIASIKEKDPYQLVNKVNQLKSIHAILLGYPPYILPSQEDAYRYTEKVLSISKKPIILYNNPLRTGFDLQLKTLEKIISNFSIEGIKEAGNTLRIGEIKQLVNSQFKIYSGGEKDLYEKIQNGVNSLSSVLGNIYPNEIKEWFENILNKQNPVNDTIQDKITEIYKRTTNLNLLSFIKHEITTNFNINMGYCRGILGK